MSDREEAIMVTESIKGEIQTRLKLEAKAKKAAKAEAKKLAERVAIASAISKSTLTLPTHYFSSWEDTTPYRPGDTIKIGGFTVTPEPEVPVEFTVKSYKVGDPFEDSSAVIKRMATSSPSHRTISPSELKEMMATAGATGAAMLEAIYHKAGVDPLTGRKVGK